MSAGGQRFPRYCISLLGPWTIRVEGNGFCPCRNGGIDEGNRPGKWGLKDTRNLVRGVIS